MPTVSCGVLEFVVSRQGESKSYYSPRNQTEDPVDGIDSMQGCDPSARVRKEGGNPWALILGEVGTGGETGACPKAHPLGREWVLTGRFKVCSAH